MVKKYYNNSIKIFIMSLAVVIMCILAYKHNFEVSADDTEFITLEVYNEYGKCVTSADITGTNKNFKSSSSNVVCDGNVIKYINTNYFGYAVNSIKSDNSNMSNYIKSNSSYIEYNSNGDETSLVLFELDDMSITEIDALKGSKITVKLLEKLYSSKFTTSKGKVKNLSGGVSSINYTLSQNARSKYYKINITVEDSTGYDIIGWRGLTDNKLYKIGDTIDLTSEQKYSAEFEPQTKTINYIGYDGKIIATDKAKYDSTVEINVTAPEVVGKQFAYWCKNSGLSEVNAVTKFKVIDDMDIYAVYTTAIHKIIFANDEETYEDKAEYGSKFKGTNKLDKVGYSVRWFTSTGVEYTENTKINSDVKLYARYTPHKVNIKIETNGGDVVYEQCNIVNGKIDFGDSIIISDITKYGYKDVTVLYNNKEIGTNEEGKYVIKIVQETDTTIVINFTENTHNIKYIDSLNRLEETEKNVYYKKEVEAKKYEPKEGYKFKGWQASTGELLQPGDKYKMPNKDVTMTALWENINYVVKLDLDGGKYISTDGNLIDEVIVLNIGNIYQLKTPIKDGYELKGWKSEKCEIVGNMYTMGSSDDTVKAIWQKKKLYTTILPNNGFFKGSTDIQTITAEYGDTVILENPVREGYTFKCWEVLSGDASLIDGNKIKCGYGNLRIGAVWINEKGEVINNSHEYVKPVDGTIDAGVILSNNGVKIQYNGAETIVNIGDSNISIDITNGIVSNYSNIINGDYLLNISNRQNVSLIKYIVVSNNIPASSVVCDLDGWQTASGSSITISKDIADGQYNIYFIIETTQGKKLMCRSTGFTLDTKAPTLTNLNDNTNAYYNSDFILNAIDENGVKSIKVNGLEVENGYQITSSGTYEIQLEDIVGNISNTIINIDKNYPKVNVKNNKYYNKSVKLKITDVGFGIQSVMLNGKSIKANKSITKAGKYTLTIIDKAGNKTKVKFVIDKSKPTVNIKENQTIKRGTKIKVKDSLSGIKYIKLDGKKISNKKAVTKKGKHVLKVCDKAGNIRTIKFKVK